MKHGRLLQWASGVTGLGFLLCGGAPLLLRVWNSGSLLLFAAGVVFTFGALWLGGLLNRKVPITKRRLAMLTGTLIAALVFTVGYTAIWSYFAYGRTPQASGEATVVVLGCKIQGDQPSLMLRRRLQRAEAYLKLNPQAKCVTSGGMGEGETYSEAYVMKKYLVSIGIEPSRIYPEEKSENTDANIKNSIALVKENNLSQNLVICTDGFHQLRAYMYARRNKVNPLAISGETPILVIPAYAVREFCGIIKMLTVG